MLRKRGRGGEEGREGVRQPNEGNPGRGGTEWESQKEEEG